MNINRDNYEEFFLLYVDNELSAEERALVEKFVQQNNDLNEEFLLLQQATLPANLTVFYKKEALFKKEDTICITNYQEYFLLYVDNELSNDQKQEVEKFVLQHPQLQAEFLQLQSAKLLPKLIPFKNKQVLYKKESRRIISMAWMRVVAAAALFGVAVTLWLTYSNNSTTNSAPIASIHTDSNASFTPQNSNALQQNVAKAPEEDKTQNEIILKDQQYAPVEVKPSSKPLVTQSTASATSVASAQLDKENLNNLPTPEANAGYFERKNSPDLEKALASTERATVIERTIDKQTISPNIETQQTNYAMAVALKEINTEADDEEKIIYIGGVEINKNKLRGIFKKASTFLDRKIKKPEVEKAPPLDSYDTTK